MPVVAVEQRAGPKRVFEQRRLRRRERGDRHLGSGEGDPPERGHGVVAKPPVLFSRIREGHAQHRDRDPGERRDRVHGFGLRDAGVTERRPGADVAGTDRDHDHIRTAHDLGRDQRRMQRDGLDLAAERLSARAGDIDQRDGAHLSDDA